MLPDAVEASEVLGSVFSQERIGTDDTLIFY